MNYNKIFVPYLGDEEIKKQADLFRKKFGGNNIPVDMESIIEITLKMNIVPVPGMRKICDDALITSDWKTIYIDYDKYYNEKYEKRLRFSYAHELGHFILHKEIYNSFNIEKTEDLYELLDKIPSKQYNHLEAQANKFAGHLLIPRERLELEKEKLFKENYSKIKDLDKEMVNSYLAIPLSHIFGVSEESVQIALLANRVSHR
jgi:Zn-dependent peptidase ImmA (M78 family)